MKRSMKTQWLLILPLCVLALSIAPAAHAQASSGGAYSVTQMVIAGGGATSSSGAGGSFELSGTIGQHDAATSSGGTFTLDGGFWPEAGFIPPPACAVDVTSQLNITRGGFSYNFVTRRFRQTITIRNNGTIGLAGPLAYVLDGLSTNATLYSPTGVTTCAAPSASPYMLVATGSDDQLAPGEAATLVLEYTNSATTQSITYTPRLLAGGLR